ncbi:hypothetical protein [Halorubellus sp. PRR65]|uniref:hypothetical protein n=1 Tax=Halorubellus sp. PRR65 TaxID=3098148 RepID=UPI002B258309|nr:hypothetical protein [Halorubellus sp. PRR65]
MREDSTRRRFVAAVGVLGAGTLAGCLGTGDDAESSTTDDGMDGMTTGDDGMTTGDDGMGEGSTTEGDDMGMEPTDPDMAERAAVDRFSDDAGTLHKRSANPDLPGPDEPIDFDRKPFWHQGLGPDGEVVQYYDLDVQPIGPAPIYVLFREGEDQPVADQLNVVGVKPGDDGYSDFWRVHEVTVPEDYEANAITSVDAIDDGDYPVEATDTLVNCPVVPDGSTAEKRVGDGDTGLTRGWYDGKTVSYFTFAEASLEVTNGVVPLSPIYVTFNTDPGEDGGGPQSGFVTEDGSAQNHNVVASLPGDDDYSPFWLVNVYDNDDFDSVMDLASAKNANVLAQGAANVNCPLVSVTESTN